VDDHEESLPDPHQARGRRGLEIGDLRDRRRAAGLDVHSSSRLTCAAREDVVASARRSANIVDVIERSPIEMQASGGTLVASDDDTLLRGLPQPPLDGSLRSARRWVPVTPERLLSTYDLHFGLGRPGCTVANVSADAPGRAVQRRAHRQVTVA
jgi:hypothetical protein